MGVAIVVSIVRFPAPVHTDAVVGGCLLKVRPTSRSDAFKHVLTWPHAAPQLGASLQKAAPLFLGGASTRSTVHDLQDAVAYLFVQHDLRIVRD